MSGALGTVHELSRKPGPEDVIAHLVDVLRAARAYVAHGEGCRVSAPDPLLVDPMCDCGALRLAGEADEVLVAYGPPPGGDAA